METPRRGDSVDNMVEANYRVFLSKCTLAFSKGMWGGQ